MSIPSADQIMFGHVASRRPRVCLIEGQRWQLGQGIVQLTSDPERAGEGMGEGSTALLLRALVQKGGEVQLAERYRALSSVDGRSVEFITSRGSFFLTVGIYRDLDTARYLSGGSIGTLTLLDFQLAEDMGQEAVLAAFSSLKAGRLLAWAPLSSAEPFC